MVGISAELSTGNELAELITELQGLNSKVLRRVSREVLPPIERELQRSIADYTPPKPDYPIRWKSQKQRRFVMAKLRRENNLPYRRTGAINRAWKIIAVVKNNVITIGAENTSPVASFIYPPDQQPFLTKWGKPDDKLLDAAARVENGVVYSIDAEIERLRRK